MQNSVYILLSRMVEFAAGILLLVLVARYLGVENFGRFAFIRAVGFFLAPIVAFGTMRIIIREISVDKRRTTEIITAGLALNLMLAMVALLAASGVPFIFDFFHGSLVMAVYLSLLAQSCLIMLQTVNAGFLAHEIAGYTAVINISGRILVLSSVFMAIVLRQSFLMIFWWIFIGNLAALTMALGMLRYSGILAGRIRILVSDLKRLLIESYPIAVVVFMTQGNTYLGTFFLRFYRGDWDVAMFESAQRIIAPLAMISTSILLAFVPLLSRLGKDKGAHDRLSKIYVITLKYFFLITFPGCVIMAIFAEPIMLILFSGDFRQAAFAFRILIWTIIPLFASGLLGFLLTSLYKQHLLMISNAACFLVNGLLAFVLVRDFGFTGASVAALISSIVLFGIGYAFVTSLLGSAGIWRIIALPGLISLIFYVVGTGEWARDSSYRIGWVLLYLMVYLIVLWMTRTLKAEELRKMFRPRREGPASFVQEGQDGEDPGKAVF